MLHGLGTAAVVIACVLIPVVCLFGVCYLIAAAFGKKADTKESARRDREAEQKWWRSLTPEQRAAILREGANKPMAQTYPTSDGRRGPNDHTTAEQAFGSKAPPYNH